MDHEQTTIHVRGAVSGDEASVAWLIERFTPALRESARYRLGTTLQRHVDPDDVVNELWITMIPKLGSLVPRDGRMTPVLLKFLSTALVRRVNNIARRFLSRPSSPRAASGELEQEVDELSAQVTGIVSRLRRDEESSKLRETLARLSDRDREVVILRGIEQAPNQEVAARLGLEPTAVALIYHRALKRLRTLLPESVFVDLEDD